MSGFPPTPGAGDGPYSGPPPRRWHHPGNGWVTPTKKLVLGILVFVLFCTVCFVAWGSYQIDRTQQAGIAGRDLPPICAEVDGDG